MAQQRTRRAEGKRRGDSITTEQLRTAREWLKEARRRAHPPRAEHASVSELSAPAPRAALGMALEQDFPRYTRAEQEHVLAALRTIEPRHWAPALGRLLLEPSLPYQVRLTLAELLSGAGVEVASDILDPLQRAQSLEAHLRERCAKPDADGNGWHGLLEELQRLPDPLAAAVVQAVGGGLHALPLLQELTAQNDAGLLAATVEALSTTPAPETAALLGQVAAKTGSKDLQKTIRRALYRFKAMGINTEGALPQETRKSVLEVPKLPIVAALASQIDFDGYRGLYLARRRPFSGLVFVGLLLQDTRGVIACQALPVSKKDLTQLVEDIRADTRLTHVELLASYAQQLVEDNYQLNLATGTPVPQEFLGLRDIIGMPDRRWEQPPIYQVLQADEVRAQVTLLSLSERLFEIREFEGWHLPAELLQPYRDDIRRVGESPIIVSQVLQQERMEAIQKKAIRELLPVEARVRYRRRLEEMAYLLWHTRRPDEAKRALAAALALQPEGADPADHPFLRALFKRSIEMAEAAEAHEASRITVATPRLWTPS